VELEEYEKTERSTFNFQHPTMLLGFSGFIPDTRNTNKTNKDKGVEVSPFLKSFRFGCAIPRNYCSQNKKSWHEM